MKIASAIILLAGPVAAQSDVFSLPAGCTAYVTVQGSACEVEHLFTCANDPDGMQRRVSLNEDGLKFAGMINAQTEWIESYYLGSGLEERLEDNPVDRANLDELLRTGRDSYDFKTLSDEVGETRYVGFDTLTGNVVEIDGVMLQETTYDITAYAADGSFAWSAKGNEFVNADWRRFLSGTGTVTTLTDTFEKDDRPAAFVFPGEPGFLSPRPMYGCGAMLSSYEVTQ